MLVVIPVLGWFNAFSDDRLTIACDAVLGASIGFIATSNKSAWSRLCASGLGSLAALTLIFIIAAALTLIQQGGYEEGGPIALALGLGWYFGLPILIIATATASLAPIVIWLWKRWRPSVR